LEFLNESVDSSVSVIRVVQLEVLKLLHFEFVLSEVLAKRSFIAELRHDKCSLIVLTLNK